MYINLNEVVYSGKIKYFFGCQGLCSKIMQNYVEILPQKLKHQKQFALILKLRINEKYNLISSRNGVLHVEIRWKVI